MHIKQSKAKGESVICRGPNHVAFVLSKGGNAAESCGPEGQRDADCFPRNIIATAVRSGVRFLTFCCLENDKAGKDSVIGVDLKLLFDLLLMDHDWLQSEDISIRFLDEGRRHDISGKGKLDISVISQLDGRGSILSAVQNIAKKIEQNEITTNDITTQMLKEQVLPIDLPDPDLLIFTGGLRRLENGFVWQAAYSELAFVEEQCQDLTAEQFQRILEEYASRDRRFGGLTKSVKASRKAG